MTSGPAFKPLDGHLSIQGVSPHYRLWADQVKSTRATAPDDEEMESKPPDGPVGCVLDEDPTDAQPSLRVVEEEEGGMAGGSTDKTVAQPDFLTRQRRGRRNNRRNTSGDRLSHPNTSTFATLLNLLLLPLSFLFLLSCSFFSVSPPRNTLSTRRHILHAGFMMMCVGVGVLVVLGYSLELFGAENTVESC